MGRITLTNNNTTHQANMKYHLLTNSPENQTINSLEEAIAYNIRNIKRLLESTQIASFSITAETEYGEWRTPFWDNQEQLQHPALKNIVLSQAKWAIYRPETFALCDDDGTAIMARTAEMILSQSPIREMESFTGHTATIVFTAANTRVTVEEYELTLKQTHTYIH